MSWVGARGGVRDSRGGARLGLLTPGYLLCPLQGRGGRQLVTVSYKFDWKGSGRLPPANDRGVSGGRPTVVEGLGEILAIGAG